MPDTDVHDFQAKLRGATLKARTTAQEHVTDLYRALDVRTLAAADMAGALSFEHAPATVARRALARVVASDEDDVRPPGGQLSRLTRRRWVSELGGIALTLRACAGFVRSGARKVVAR